VRDRAALLVAGAAVLGALIGHGPTPWVGALLVGVAFAVHRPVLLMVAALVLTGGLAAQAQAGLEPVTPGAVVVPATLLTDPSPAASGLEADARLADGRHVLVVARAPDAEASLRDRHAGDHAQIAGRLQRSPPMANWLEVRHIVGVLAVDRFESWSAGDPAHRAADWLRTTLADGARALPERQRPLFLGFVIGDTRGQAPDITDDFRGAGLSHLLAVSGENVAFVLALAGPLLRRLNLRARLPATVAVIGFFALVTRFEPSVLRASAMAAIAVTAAALGREATTLRVLALAVAGLVVLDPFLVRVVGFQLSVAASFGIALLSAPIARVLPGPRSLAEAAAVTLAAQLAVAPVLVAVFGGVPVAGMPANVLAAPAAGPVMVWGLGAGLVAGLAGGPVAALLHWPTRLLIAWIAGVAAWAAALPLGELHWPQLVALAFGIGAIAVARAHGGVIVRAGGIAVATIAVAAPAVALRAPATGAVALAPGATLWRAGDRAALELDGRADPGAVLEALRRAGINRLDVVVARTASGRVGDTVDAVRRRTDVDRVLGPPGASLAGATPVNDPVEVDLGAIVLDVEPNGNGLTIDARHPVVEAGRARGPPV
jgi:competence protein ComEC